MGLISRGVADVKHDGLAGANRGVYRIARAGLGSILQHVGGRGVNIFERDWDVLLLLDACRADLMTEVVSEYEFLSNMETVWSVGSSTPEWIRNTFTDDYTAEMATTAYVTGNPFSEDFVDTSGFIEVDEVWRHVWDEATNTIPARPITDAVIRLARSRAPNRLIAHYMQPHATFIPDAEYFDVDGRHDSVWMALREGEFDRETVWAAYRNNLRYVLNDVKLLLTNIDADRVVITSDHGNAMGEYGIYGHPKGYPLTCLRTVPWIETSARDAHTYEPDQKSASTPPDISEQLRSLGYIVD